MNEHANHRQRMRSRFMKSGLDSFDDHQVLELLLFYAIPRVDTNETAHRLLNKFGSLPEVCLASYDELRKVEGIGDNAATFIRFVSDFSRRVSLSEFKKNERYGTLDQVGKYLISLFKGEPVEKIYLACFNGKMELIGCPLLAIGKLSFATVSARMVFETAIKTEAAGIILTHNHPDGMASPSQSDIDYTDRLQYLCREVDVNLLEHIIVGENSYYPVIRAKTRPSINECDFKIHDK